MIQFDKTIPVELSGERAHFLIDQCRTPQDRRKLIKQRTAEIVRDFCLHFEVALISFRFLFAFFSLSSRFLPLIEPIRETHKQDGKRAIADRGAFGRNVKVTMNDRPPFPYAIQAGTALSLWPCAWSVCVREKPETV